MANRLFLVATLLLSSLAATGHAEILFSTLKRSLLVAASHRQGVLKAGEDDITLTWSYNNTNQAGTDSTYKTIKVQLCYAPVSQKDRAWRRTEDHLKKDKTCQFNIVTMPYKSAAKNNFTWNIERDVPTGTYFVRAYALNSAGEESGYGQSTNDEKTKDLFEIQAISGRHATLDICSVVFSVFSIVALAGFFYMEKRNAKANQQK